jgi:uncharacterized protein YbaR (Trm112 family)
MKAIQSPGDFQAMLHAERAVVFIWFPWSARSEESQDVFQRWLAEDATTGKKDFAVYELAPDGLPFTWRWVNEIIGDSDDGEMSAGSVVWLKNGDVAGFIPDAGRAGVRTLSRATQKCFGDETANAMGGGEPFAFDVELLKILCCPESHQELKLAAAAVVEQLNEKIAAGRLQNRAGQPVREKISGGLVRMDGRIVYPLRENIPVLLVDEGIPLAN